MDELYYKRMGLMSPAELLQSAIMSTNIDSGIASLLSALAAIRNQGEVELELEFFDYIKSFLRKNVRGYEEEVMRGKAKWN